MGATPIAPTALSGISFPKICSRLLFQELPSGDGKREWPR